VKIADYRKTSCISGTSELVGGVEAISENYRTLAGVTPWWD
jgi:hypothetical protein